MIHEMQDLILFSFFGFLFPFSYDGQFSSSDSDSDSDPLLGSMDGVGVGDGRGRGRGSGKGNLQGSDSPFFCLSSSKLLFCTLISGSLTCSLHEEDMMMLMTR